MVWVSARPVVRAHARIVDDFVGDGDLAAEIVLFENQHAVASAGQVQAGRQASRPATNDDDVIEIVGLSHENSLTYTGSPL